MFFPELRLVLNSPFPVAIVSPSQSPFFAGLFATVSIATPPWLHLGQLNPLLQPVMV